MYVSIMAYFNSSALVLVVCMYTRLSWYLWLAGVLLIRSYDVLPVVTKAGREINRKRTKRHKLSMTNEYPRLKLPVVACQVYCNTQCILLCTV